MAGDYGKAQSVTAKEAVVQIGLAEKFLALAAERLGPLPPIPEGQPKVAPTGYGRFLAS